MNLHAACQALASGSSVRVMGIESSCDETGCGIVEVEMADGRPRLKVLADVVASSMEQHARFGGVVPEIASRAHLESIGPVVTQALSQAGCERVDAVCATVGPGLAGAVLVGASAAKALALGWQVPFYGLNHLGGHVAVADLESDEPLPHAVALLVSGGHTQLLEVNGIGQPMVELGSTLDDAAGEAYDKVARLLRLGYPGGPIIDKLARQGNRKAIAFPRAMTKHADHAYDFSFSGLKTAVARYVENAEATGDTICVVDMCASFQEAVCDVLTSKAVAACTNVGADVLLLGGGVAANSRLRELAKRRCDSAGVKLRVPRPRLCTDNGVMIAALGCHRIAAGYPASSLDVGCDPNLPVSTPQL